MFWVLNINSKILVRLGVAKENCQLSGIPWLLALKNLLPVIVCYERVITLYKDKLLNNSIHSTNIRIMKSD